MASNIPITLNSQGIEILLGFYSVIFVESLREVAEIGISDFIAYFGYRVKTSGKQTLCPFHLFG